jgi:hypothetical protein
VSTGALIVVWVARFILPARGRVCARADASNGGPYPNLLLGWHDLRDCAARASGAGTKAFRREAGMANLRHLSSLPDAR